MKPRVAILDDYQGIALRMADWSALQQRCELVSFDRHLEEDEAVAALQDFDAVCLLRERMAFPASLIERLPRLRFIAVTGIRNRTLDLEAALGRGIVVSHTERRGDGLGATAELAWGLILALARHLPQEFANMREGRWQTTLGTALGGRTLGLLGLGRLGRRMVPVARAFGMDVVAWSQNLTDEAAQAAGCRRVDKQELFARSDFISLHLVLSERSRHIVGAQELAAMQPHAVIVNTSRGPLIDRAALVEALQAGRIAGAGLDTFDVEPLPAGDPLRRLPNVVLTPHLGYTVEELLRPFYEDTVENLAAFLDGRPLRLLRPDTPGH
ncbi:D-2-hydroxyacid dehydrogenase family protein [Paracidovorax cattleyae]|uniref:Lactate dehydrogenase n=1 Tax=Paracidovorax cattleyae TaxID=80868 RepID=A0A1H0WAT8_9BURK|nr:D-2-hydroxyacid dehydrogenase family protein [Paracidovorax cattleyae]SDP87565.1 Lactate dehydrogenase [Paracidovorax cattleyae]